MVRARRVIATAVVAALIGPPVGELPASAGPGYLQQPQIDKPIPGVRVEALTRPADPAEAASARTAARPAPKWPQPSTVDISLSGSEPGAGAAAAAPVRAGSLPVYLRPAATGSKGQGPARVRVRTLDRAAASASGIDGLILAVQRSDGVATAASVEVSVDYGEFASAYGGSWAARLRAVQLPGATVLPSTNDVRAKRLSVTVPVRNATTTIALTAGPQGSDGDFGATSLAPSAVWSAGGNAGDFTWSYPMRVPPAANGPAPQVSLSYSAQSVDGHTAASNNQPSWIGEGFDWQPGYVERRYKTCADDMNTPGRNNSVKTYDLCWATDNAVISLPGHTGELIKSSTDTNRWHLRQDDAALIVRKTGAGNGTPNGEWWVLTDKAGAQYWFGGVPSSGSTWTAPVYGNNPNEPCHQSSYAASSCVQAWRWNLDHVVDVHGNTMSFTYVKETNKYGRNMSTSDLASYDRGGYLDRIDYGTRTGGTGPAPAQVKLDVADRCLEGCAIRDAVHWPDVPWDQNCTGSPCLHHGPTFWSTKRLNRVTTKVWDAAATPSGYSDVERWVLTHSFPSPGDGSRAGLWLSRISHTGLVGGETNVPDIVLSGVQLQNRVDTIGDQLYPMNWWRMARIDSEFGGAIIVRYEPPECVAGTPAMPDLHALQNNTLRCYPVRWTPEGSDDPILDFFHKYVVKEVREGDLTGGAPDVLHAYEYVGGGAWHYTDDDGLVKAENKTWSEWRGYAGVRERTGDATKLNQTYAESQFFRGMHGDHLPSGTRSVTLPAIDMNGNGNTTDPGVDVPPTDDVNAFAGVTRRQMTFNGVGGAEMASTAFVPWRSEPTATRTINGSTVEARFTGVAGVHTRTATDNDHGTRPAGWRTTTATTTFDALGMAVKVDDRGNNAVGDDQKCVLTEYVRTMDVPNTLWLVTLAKRIRTFGVGCATAEGGNLTADDIISDEKNLYDLLPYGAAPVRGLVTEQQVAKDLSGGTPTFLTVSKARYDANGRATDRWDVDNRLTTIGYEPSTGLATRVVTTNPKGWTVTNTLAPAWGEVVSTVDVNGKRTDITRDGLGRITTVWLPGQSKSAGHPATYTYAYTVRTNGTNAVTANRLNPAGTGYLTTITVYDGLLRPRQTQAADTAVAGARAVVDTIYDSAGRTRRSTIPYPMTGAPSTDLYNPRPPAYSGPEALPGWTESLYDGAGRITDSILFSRNVEQWRTRTTYGGDRIDVTPPLGGTATSTVADAAGKIVAMRQYHGANPTGPFDLYRHRFNRKGKPDLVTDPAGNTWQYGYNLRGQQTSIDEPDRGGTVLTYYANGSLKTATDARGATVAYTYDELGRKTSIRDGSETGRVRAEWTYDTVAKGQLGKATRYVQNGAATDAYTVEALSYSERYQPGTVRYTLPPSQTGFGASTFTYTNFRNADQSQSAVRIPAAGGLPLETLSYGYDANGLPSTLTGGAGTLVTGTSYTNYGDPSIITLRNNAGPITQIGTYYYDDGARRLREMKTTSAAPPTTFADSILTYDGAGNITKVAESTSGDSQCFRYDHARRLKEAWTPTGGNCGPDPTVPAIGGPAKYWQSFTYDAAGNRRTFTDHNAVETNATYSYPASSVQQPHTVSNVDYQGATTLSANYTYDPAGNTLCRPSGSFTNDCATGTGSQRLFWDAEGRLETVAEAGGTTRYIYDADGNRLLRVDPAGKTLFLPLQEIRVAAGTGTVTCTRYYPFAGRTVATRSNAAGSLTWLSGNQQQTEVLSITAANQAASTRWFTPFGGLRGATKGWPAIVNTGLVSGTVDNTGTTHLGQREYDPALGAFLSRDPLMNIRDPQHWHGYRYSGDNPTTFSDPTGLMRERDDGPVQVGGNPIAHGVAITLRVLHLKRKYPHARITSDPTSGRKGPDIVCWDCVPDLVWVWEVKPEGRGKNGAEGMANALADLPRHLEQARLDPLAEGRPAVPGPPNAFDGPDVGVNPVAPSERITVRSRAPGVELYRVDKFKDEKPNKRFMKRTLEAAAVTDQLNREADDTRDEMVRTGTVKPPYEAPPPPTMQSGEVTSGPEDVVVYTAVLFFVLWGGVVVVGAGGASAAAAGAARGAAARCRAQYGLAC